jgi:hypothetical protein
VLERACIGALLVAALSGTAHGDEAEGGGRSFESELGLAVVYSNADIVSVGGFVGFSFGKPILDVFYLEPVLHAEFGLWNAGRLTGLLRCNFVASVGTVVSLGFGAGTGWKTFTNEDTFEDFTVARDHRVIEVGIKKGGKRRFLIGLALALDKDEMGVESKAVMLQTTIVRAAP